MSRDNFSKDNTKIIAEIAGYLCSNPNCRILTSGPHTNKNKSLKNGVAAHVYAASANGPRYNVDQTPDERSSPDNGIWLCHNCSDLVDKDPIQYNVEILCKWKKEHAIYIENLRQTGNQNIKKGGKGGNIFIFTQHLSGNGLITANGGDGLIGGDAGSIRIHARRDNFTGTISAKGGNVTNIVQNLIKQIPRNKDINPLYKKLLYEAKKWSYDAKLAGSRIYLDFSHNHCTYHIIGFIDSQIRHERKKLWVPDIYEIIEEQNSGAVKPLPKLTKYKYWQRAVSKVLESTASDVEKLDSCKIQILPLGNLSISIFFEKLPRKWSKHFELKEGKLYEGKHVICQIP